MLIKNDFFGQLNYLNFFLNLTRTAFFTWQVYDKKIKGYV